MKKRIISSIFMMIMVFFCISASLVIASDDIKADQNQSFVEDNAVEGKTLEEFEESQDPNWDYDEESEKKALGNPELNQQEVYEEYESDTNYVDDSYNQEPDQQEVNEENKADGYAEDDSNWDQ
jgi:hypothetical protein